MKKILIIILILSIILTGCNGGKRNPPIPAIYTGTEGINIDFMKNVPPQKIFENQTIIVMLQLHNRGAYSLDETKSENKGYVHIDFDPFYFTSTIRSTEFMLQGKSLDFPKGDSILIDAAQMKANPIVGTRAIPKTKITASVCYPYETILSKEVCIDQDYLQVQRNPICTNPGIYTMSSQGAPIAITKIEADMLPLGDNVVQPVFRITLRNAGRGLVITKKEGMRMFDLCSPVRADSHPNNFNILKLSAWLGSEDNLLECEPKNAVLWNNEVEITCTINPTTQNYIPPEGHSSNSNYMSFLTIKAEYVYREFVSREIEIARMYR